MIKESKFESAPEKSRGQKLEELSAAVNKINNLHNQILGLEEKLKDYKLSSKEKESVNKEIIELSEQLSKTAYNLPDAAQNYHDEVLASEENAG